MKWDDVIEKDNRTFFQYFNESIKEKKLIINTFFVVDNINNKNNILFIKNGFLFII